MITIEQILTHLGYEPGPGDIFASDGTKSALFVRQKPYKNGGMTALSKMIVRLTVSHQGDVAHTIGFARGYDYDDDTFTWEVEDFRKMILPLPDDECGVELDLDIFSDLYEGQPAGLVPIPTHDWQELEYTGRLCLIKLPSVRTASVVYDDLFHFATGGYRSGFTAHLHIRQPHEKFHPHGDHTGFCLGAGYRKGGDEYDKAMALAALTSYKPNEFSYYSAGGVICEGCGRDDVVAYSGMLCGDCYKKRNSGTRHPGVSRNNTCLYCDNTFPSRFMACGRPHDTTTRVDVCAVTGKDTMQELFHQRCGHMPDIIRLSRFNCRCKGKHSLDGFYQGNIEACSFISRYATRKEIENG